MARAISFAVLVLATSVLLALFYQVVSVFLLPLFLAMVAVLLLRPLQVKATAWCGNRRYLAAGLMTAGVLLAVLIPASVVLVVAGAEAVQLANSMKDADFNARVHRLRTNLDLHFPFIDECRFIESSLARLQDRASTNAVEERDRGVLRQIATEFQEMHSQVPEHLSPPFRPNADPVTQAFEAALKSEPGTLRYSKSLVALGDAFDDYQVAMAGGPWRLAVKEVSHPDRSDLKRLAEAAFSLTTDHLASISGSLTVLAARSAFSLMIFVMALFFWFADGPEIISALMTLSPLEDKYERQLLADFERLVRAVVAGSIASAVAQSVLAGLGFWIAGVESVFLLMATTAVCAMVPFVGASLVWIPVSAWLAFAEGRMMAGVGLALYGLVVISTVDNVVRPWIIVEKASLHPLAALVGVLGGIQALGPTGVFVGPIVVAFLQTTLTLLHREFADGGGLISWKGGANAKS